jgi:DNA-binding Lrp family transcriptional regulator
MASLHDIHVATRISKPSLLRILNTLEHAGVVSRRLVDGRYRIVERLGSGGMAEVFLARLESIPELTSVQLVSSTRVDGDTGLVYQFSIQAGSESADTPLTSRSRFSLVNAPTAGAVV